MIKTFSHIIISLLLFTLTMGVNISKHYSNGELYSQSFFGNAESCNSSEAMSCDMQDMNEPCEMHKEQNAQNNGVDLCSCEDTSDYLHFDINYTVTDKLTVQKKYEKEIPFFLSINFVNNYSVNKEIQNTINGKCLLKIPDFQTLFQVFRC